MSNTLSVKVSTRKDESGEWYEGTVSITGLKPTKLARKSDGSTKFTSKSAVSGAARNLAKSLGFAGVDVLDSSKPAAAAPKKAAAKKSVKSSESTTWTTSNS